MNRSPYTIVVFTMLLSILCFAANAQSDSLCRLELKKVFDQVHSLTKPEPGFVGNLKYSVFIKSKGDNRTDVKENVDLVIGDKYFSVKTAGASIFSDSSVQIVIYHPQKNILITYPQTDAMKDNKMEQLKAFQSNIITTAKEVKCTEESYELTTSLNMNGYEVESIEYFTEAEDAFFKSSVIHFKNNTVIDFLEFKISDFNLSKEKKDPPSIWNSFKDQNGQIKKEFEAFKIVDLRKNEDEI